MRSLFGKQKHGREQGKSEKAEKRRKKVNWKRNLLNFTEFSSFGVFIIKHTTKKNQENCTRFSHHQR